MDGMNAVGSILDHLVKFNFSCSWGTEECTSATVSSWFSKKVWFS